MQKVNVFRPRLRGILRFAHWCTGSLGRDPNDSSMRGKVVCPAGNKVTEVHAQGKVRESERGLPVTQLRCGWFLVHVRVMLRAVDIRVRHVRSIHREFMMA